MGRRAVDIPPLPAAGYALRLMHRGLRSSGVRRWPCGRGLSQSLPASAAETRADPVRKAAATAALDHGRRRAAREPALEDRPVLERAVARAVDAKRVELALARLWAVLIEGDLDRQRNQRGGLAGDRRR